MFRMCLNLNGYQFKTRRWSYKSTNMNIMVAKGQNTQQLCKNQKEGNRNIVIKKIIQLQEKKQKDKGMNNKDIWKTRNKLAIRTCMFTQSLSHAQFFATPWTVDCQTPLSMGILQTRILEWVAAPSFREQGIFPTQGSNPGLLHCRWFLYHLNHEGSPTILEQVACPFSKGTSLPRN